MQKFNKENYKKFQGGGNLINKDYSGTWGNRGQGNEIQSALENGLSGLWSGIKWVGDKVLNAGDYIDQGLAYATGLLVPGEGLTAYEMLQNEKNKQQARNSGQLGYVTQSGEYKVFPMTGIPPQLPSLPRGASPYALELYNKLKKLKASYATRESQLRKLGQLDRMESTVTAQRYKETEALLKKELSKPKKKTSDKVTLTKKQTSEYKHSKQMATGDGRANNGGRPSMAQWRYAESVMRKDKDPAVISTLNRYDVKVAKGNDPTSLRKAYKDMIIWYAHRRPGFFDHLLKNLE